MRTDHFIGAKTISPGVLWLVNRRFHYQWLAYGGRVVRAAKPDDGITDKWCPIRKAKKELAARVAMSEGAGEVAIPSTTEPAPAPKAKRKRRSRKKVAA